MLIFNLGYRRPFHPVRGWQSVEVMQSGPVGTSSIGSWSLHSLMFFKITILSILYSTLLVRLIVSPLTSSGRFTNSRLRNSDRTIHVSARCIVKSVVTWRTCYQDMLILPSFDHHVIIVFNLFYLKLFIFSFFFLIFLFSYWFLFCFF